MFVCIAITVGITTYFNNLEQETTLPGGKRLVRPPTPKHKSPQHLQKVKKNEDIAIQKAKARIAVGLNTYFAGKEEIGDLKQGRQYIPPPPPRQPKPTGVKFPIQTVSYERWKKLDPANLPDNTKPRGPKIVEHCGVWKLSGREPASRMPSGYDPEHKKGKKHYWGNRNRFNDGRHAVQTMVGQMLDWTKCKNKLWYNELHKKQLLDTRFFEKKKFIDQRNRQEQQIYSTSTDVSDQRPYQRGHYHPDKQADGQGHIFRASRRNHNVNRIYGSDSEKVRENGTYGSDSKKVHIVRRPQHAHARHQNRSRSRGGRKHYLRKKRLGGVVQV